MEPTFLTYKDYKAVDFFQDSRFTDSILSGGEGAQLFWAALAEAYPALAEEMAVAESWILLVQSQRAYAGKRSAESRWKGIQDRLPSYARQQVRVRRIYQSLRWSAGIAALFLAVILIYEVSQFGTKQMGTTFGERREVLLPDASRIQLNSNSKLHYVRNWKTDKPREVWFEGEGMFQVKHTALKNRLRENDLFVVHVGDLSLTVLGTTFNVKDRRGRIEVTLFEGSVRIQGENGLDRMLLPGETFIYDEQERADQIVQKNVDGVSSWTRGELNVEHDNLANIIDVLEDNYGYQVILQDSSLLNKRLTGTIPVKSINDILFVLKHTMDVRIRVDNKQIFINPN